MVDRLRALLDRPLDPSAARAILILASGIFLSLAGLLILAAGSSGPDPEAVRQQSQLSPLDSAPVPPVEEGDDDGRRQPPPRHRQDPQDVSGSVAAGRAARALRSHRALQHVPYRSGGVTIVLAGARGSRALLRVTASTLPAARRGWHRFLRRYRDSGQAYIPVFDRSGVRRG
jgi:hypothetical protein